MRASRHAAENCGLIHEFLSEQSQFQYALMHMPACVCVCVCVCVHLSNRVCEHTPFKLRRAFDTHRTLSFFLSAPLVVHEIINSTSFTDVISVLSDGQQVK